MKSFISHTRASAAVEFALLFPMSAWIILMIMQVGLYFYYTATLQTGLDAAVRQILVGNAANANVTEAQFINNDLCPNLPTLTCASIVVNFIQAPTDFYSLTNKTADSNLSLGYSLTGLNTPTMNNANTSFCIGGNGSVMVAQVYYPMPVLGIPAFANSATYNGQLVVWIQANSVFKNEPFSTLYSGC